MPCVLDCGPSCSKGAWPSPMGSVTRRLPCFAGCRRAGTGSGGCEVCRVGMRALSLGRDRWLGRRGGTKKPAPKHCSSRALGGIGLAGCLSNFLAPARGLSGCAKVVLRRALSGDLHGCLKVSGAWPRACSLHRPHPQPDRLRPHHEDAPLDRREPPVKSRPVVPLAPNTENSLAGSGGSPFPEPRIPCRSAGAHLHCDWEEADPHRHVLDLPMTELCLPFARAPLNTSLAEIVRSSCRESVYRLV